MAVILLTLTISLCLAATFVLFFLRESAHRSFSSAEHDSLLPLAEEEPTLAGRSGKKPSGSGSHACGCTADGASGGSSSPCAACRNHSAGRRADTALSMGA